MLNYQNMTYTRRLDSTLNDLKKEFSTVCGKRDFERKLLALKESEGFSDYGSKLRSLTNLFDMRGIPYELGRDYKYYENIVKSSELPDSIDVENRILYSLYRAFKRFPNPEAYMRRLVDRLSLEKDGWGTDSLRLRILKRFIKYAGCFKYTVETIDETGKVKKTTEVIYGGEGYIKKYIKNVLGKSSKTVDDILESIDDGVFEVLKTASREQLRARGTYGLLNMADELANGEFKTGGATKRALYMFAMAYGMTYFSGDTNNGEILDSRTDLETNLFRDYYTNNLMRFLTSAYEGSLSAFELDPSGQGINYKNYAEMVYLYYISKSMEPCEKIKCSNEMIKRLIEREKSGVPKIKSSKNEENTVYFRGLFKIDKTDGVFVEDALRLTEEKFEDFIYNNYDIENEENEGPLMINTDQQTAYKEYLGILSRLIAELKKQDGIFVADDFSLADLSEHDRKLEMDKWLGACNYGLWFADTNAYKDDDTLYTKNNAETMYERVCSVGEKWPGVYDDFEKPDEESFKKFLAVLKAANDFIGYQQSAQEKAKALCVTSPEKVTRTSIITAFYYYYNAVQDSEEDKKSEEGEEPEDSKESNEYKKSADRNSDSFEKLFESFRGDIDKILESAHYQKFSGKNLFDILIAFSAYAITAL